MNWRNVRTWPILAFFACLRMTGTLSLQAQEVEDQTEAPEILDEIVAKVNAEVITLTELNLEFSRLRRSLGATNPDPEDVEVQFQEQKPDVLRGLIQTKLMVQRAEDLGLSARIDEEVANYIEQQRSDMGIPSMEVFERELIKQTGETMNAYRRRLKEAYTQSAVIGQFVTSRITVMTPEIEQYYQDNIEKYTNPATIELAEIVVHSEGKDVEWVRQRADEAREKALSGTEFSQIAQDYSDGPTASQGGTLGVFESGELSEALEAKLFLLEEGEMSEVLEQDFGLQFFKVLKKTLPQAKPLEEVKEQISNEIFRTKAQPDIDRFLRQVRDESYVWIAPKYRDAFNVEDYY